MTNESQPVSRNCGLKDAVMGGWYQQATGELFRGFNITPDDIVLDVGCGPGGNTLFCARQGAYVIFTDPDAVKIESIKAQIAQTQAKGWEGYVSNSAPLPIKENTATRVILSEVLEHVATPSALMAEIVRVAKPGALFFLTVPDKQSEELQKRVAPALHFASPNHINIFSRDDFRALVTESGLQIEHQHTYGFFWSIWMTLYWATKRAAGETFEGATFDQLTPPFDPLLEEWAKVWQSIIDLPNDGATIRQALDEVLPKNQIIIARKPL